MHMHAGYEASAEHTLQGNTGLHTDKYSSQVFAAHNLQQSCTCLPVQVFSLCWTHLATKTSTTPLNGLTQSFLPSKKMDI